MHHVNEGGIAGLHLADQEHRPGRLGDKVQLLGADIDVAQKDVIRNDALDESRLVMLLLVIGLGAVQATVTMEQMSRACSSLPWTKAA